VRWLAASFVLAGCGRLGFDALPGTTGDAPTEVPDDTVAVDRCAIPITAPASIVVSGRTVNATQFGAVLIPEPDVQLTVRNRFNGPLIGAGTSDQDGNFALNVSLGGAPRELSILAEKGGWISTALLPGYLVDRDLVVDLPITDIGGIDSLYGAGGATRDLGRGTVLVEVRDCAESAVTGAQVLAAPPPQALVYPDGQGIPSPALNSTSATGAAYALNANAMTTSFQASRSGLLYLQRTVAIAPGDLVMIVQLFPTQ
jgi:hypothetical protein